MDVSGDLLDTAMRFFNCWTPLHKASLFGHPDYCQSEGKPETLQLFLLQHEVKYFEMDVSYDLLDTAMGSLEVVNSTS